MTTHIKTNRTVNNATFLLLETYIESNFLVEHFLVTLIDKFHIVKMYSIKNGLFFV